ncbi:hypothetical protein BaRGS_00012400 [Batillaria attramentaria]|uniref:Uncharacterized protein n=1 Tax=Batillaria attramentaria TaxID=370345 RepID=A0ABD0LAT4_9CAEN
MFCPRDRCYSDLGSDGTVAVVIAGENVGDPYTVQTFAPDGSTLGSGSDPEQIGDVLNDIAVDPVNKQVSNWCLVIIASYNERPPRKIPCVIAFDYTIQDQQWHDFCVTAEEEELARKTASIWIQRMHFSDFDNKLYVVANSHGGNMVLLLNPADIHNNNDSLEGQAIQKYDIYTQTWGFHGHHVITYLARYNPQDGALEAASFIVPRFQHEDECHYSTPCVGDSVSADISAGPDGTILVAHNASKYIEHRSNLTINGQTLAAYQGPQEAVLLGVPPALDRRLIWHHFAKTPGASQAVAVAAGIYQDRTHVVFIASSSENEFVRVNELPGTGRAPSSITQSALIVLEMPGLENPDIIDYYWGQDFIQPCSVRHNFSFLNDHIVSVKASDKSNF